MGHATAGPVDRDDLCHAELLELVRSFANLTGSSLGIRRPQPRTATGSVIHAVSSPQRVAAGCMRARKVSSAAALRAWSWPDVSARPKLVDEHHRLDRVLLARVDKRPGERGQQLVRDRAERGVGVAGGAEERCRELVHALWRSARRAALQRLGDVPIEAVTERLVGLPSTPTTTRPAREETTTSRS